MYLKGAPLIEIKFRNKCMSKGCPLNVDFCQERFNSLTERESG